MLLSPPPRIQTSSHTNDRCANCVRLQSENERLNREVQKYKSLDEFFETEVTCVADEEELVKSILVWVRTRHLRQTGRHVSLLEYIEAADQSC